MKKLVNYSWYRNLFSENTFLEVDGEWINLTKYSKGKVTKVEGKWNTQAFCKCGNELIHSNSFKEEVKMPNNYVWHYKCSNCDSVQYWNPDIIPGLLPCNINGIPT